ncbi:MAG: serine hydrolase domain-containing protein [Gaiellaceae bacterium]
MPRQLTPSLRGELDELAGTSGFSGVVRIDRGGDMELGAAYGLADRRYRIPNGLDTLFGIASGTKSLTAATVISLVEDGVLELGTTARSLLGSDLPLIRDDVTVEDLLAHRSGIGDYYDEDVHSSSLDYVLPVPVHELTATERYLTVLDGHETKFEPGERFAYCNSGYVVLALLAERASGIAFDELVRARVCEPAGMADTAFLRMDELPARAAVGYLEKDGLRTNVLHLPVRGSGDGGIFATVADVSAFWRGFFGGEIVSAVWIAEMTRPRHDEGPKSYGLGFWLDPSGGSVALEGADAGVSFRSVRLPAEELTHTVISNTSDGAWPLARLLRDRLA